MQSGASSKSASTACRLRRVVFPQKGRLWLALLAGAMLLMPWSYAAGRTNAQRAPGYLGIEFHDLTRQQAEELHLRGPQGVEVLLVDHDGPAASAGLKPHDLITGINGRMVASGEALRRMIHETGAGVQVTLDVFRNGRPITIRARLANHEDVERKAWARLNSPDPAPAATDHPAVAEGFAESTGDASRMTPAAEPHTQSFLSSILHGPFTGVVVEAMPPQLATYFGAPSGHGLLVQSVAAGSPAAVAGLQAGDVILRANNQVMSTSSEWSKQLHASKGKTLTLDLLRERSEMFLTLQPESTRH
jgi:S1-C subfamily serine protease